MYENHKLYPQEKLALKAVAAASIGAVACFGIAKGYQTETNRAPRETCIIEALPGEDMHSIATDLTEAYLSPENKVEINATEHSQQEHQGDITTNSWRIAEQNHISPSSTLGPYQPLKLTDSLCTAARKTGRPVENVLPRL